jgi:hypothetical protein
MEDERGPRDGGEHAAHVGLGRHLEPGDGRRRAGAVDHPVVPILLRGPVVCNARRPQLQQPIRVAAPVCRDLAREHAGLLRSQSPRVVVGPRDPGEAAIEHQRLDAFRVAGGEQRVERAALRDPEHDGALASGGVHHGAEIVHPLLHRGQPLRRDTV